MPFAPAILVALVVLSGLAAIWDWRFRRIPNWLCLAGLIAGFVLNGILYGLAGLATAGIGFLVGFAIYLILYVLHAKCAGDVKLMAAIGSIVGWREWFLIFVVSAIIGAVAGIIYAATKGRAQRILSNVGYIVSEFAHFRAPHVRREDVDVQSEKSLRIPGGTVTGAAVFVILAYAWLRHP